MLEPWIAWSVSLPSCSSQFISMQTWDCPTCQPQHRLPGLSPCHTSSLLQLPISDPPTSLDECFFFNSLVVGLPYHLIFWKFLLFWFLNWLLSFFWLCKEAKHICLQPPSWPEVPIDKEKIFYNTCNKQDVPLSLLYILIRKRQTILLNSG